MPEIACLRIVGRRVELDADLAQALVGRGIVQLAVDADQLLVSGEFTLPGGTVHLRCRELSGDQAVIDVSGRKPPAPWGESPAADGQAGQDGAAGAAGGVRIVCQRLLSAPRILACGSPGGDSQGGGNGLKPATPDTRRAGAFNKAKDGGLFGGRVLKKFGLSYFLSIAYGEHGHEGAMGGEGLPPGQPGRGGDGGRIDVTCGEPLPASVDMCVDPGAPGVCGAVGKGGKGGDGGLGGLNRLYRYQWFKKTFDLPMNAKNAEVKAALKAFKLSSRAASGRPGPVGSDSTVQFTAASGAPGVMCCQSGQAVDLAPDFDADFLRHATTWAEQALACAEAGAAEAIARWALSLLDAGAAAADAPALRQALEALLARVQPSPADAIVVQA